MDAPWIRTVWRHRDVMWDGLVVTMQVTAIGFVGAVVLGFVLCLLVMYVKPLRWPARVLIEFFRATPIYVQLLWVNYVWPGVLGWPSSFFEAGCAALAVQSAGYLAETFRAGIEGISRGHVEAARAQGMSSLLVMRRIILPQAFHTMAPSIMNQFLVVIKSSTLVSVIAVPDLMYQALRLTAIWFEPIAILSCTALVYITVITCLSLVFKWYTDRLRERYL
ncbi:MAG: amino acid ABC transporter permease [Ectothiorhodospiraceae bacterium]|nr:amino acid ABC transporter permease [Chromatiales bacterium]MCP5154060.1 amino acid ABC transporter permease [Ectothiorhodospiraceae bacterium]